jgi:glyoxylase-like metal-dependent hydrolase (beta-lactamase superfamily II)
MSPTFSEIAPGIFVLRHPVLDVNTTLVTGDGGALIVDTLSTARQAGELAAAARAVTADPWSVVNTHHHFDHCFGNATVAAPDRPVWAHEEAAALLRQHAERMRRAYWQRWRDDDPVLADDLAQVQVLPPTHTFHLEQVLDVGGRTVVLRHLGMGHTGGDLVVHVPDADVVVAGDLVEQGAPPCFDDAYPLEWPETVAALLRLAGPSTVVVPGHGAVVDRAFVKAQHDELTALEWLIREGHADRAPAEAVAARAPFGAEVALRAVRRGYAELDGRA